MVDNPFYAFVNLVELDQSIDQRTIKREKLQKVIDQTTERSHQQQAAVAAAEQILQTLRKQLHQAELELKTFQQQEQKKRSQLDAVNTAKEYAALEHELQAILKEAQAKEETIFVIWAQFEQQELLVKKETQELQHLFKKNQEEIANIEHERLKLAQEVEELTANRAHYLHAAPEEYVAKYQAMRNSLKNPVVPVVENICSACSTQLMQTDLLQLRRHVIVPCKACYRLLYMK